MGLIPGKRRIPKSTTHSRRQQRELPNQIRETMMGDTIITKGHCNEKEEDPECQCYLRRGIFLPPGLHLVQDQDNTNTGNDGAYGRR